MRAATTLSATLCALSAPVASATWADYTADTDTQVAETCDGVEFSCLGPIFHDGDIDDLCNKIIDSPCDNQSVPVEVGLIFWATYKDCNPDSAKPTLEACQEYVINTRAKANDGDCSVATEVKDTDGNYQGDIAMTGHCLPMDPLGKK